MLPTLPRHETPTSRLVRGQPQAGDVVMTHPRPTSSGGPSHGSPEANHRQATHFRVTREHLRRCSGRCPTQPTTPIPERVSVCSPVLLNVPKSKGRHEYSIIYLYRRRRWSGREYGALFPHSDHYFNPHIMAKCNVQSWSRPCEKSSPRPSPTSANSPGRGAHTLNIAYSPANLAKDHAKHSFNHSNSTHLENVSSAPCTG